MGTISLPFSSANSGTLSSSLERVGKINRQTKKDVQSSQPGDLSQSNRVLVSDVAGTYPAVQEVAPEEEPADFYRYGQGTIATDNNQTIEVAAGAINQQSQAPGGVDFSILPQTLADFDEQEASIRLVGKKQGSKKEVDLIPKWTKFILQQAAESYNERTQIVETFGDYYVFFFGQRPVIYNFSGMLINAKNNSWVNDWKFMYQNFLRGTKAVENKARIILSYGGRQIEGYILNTNNSTTADTEFGVPFSFQVLLIDEKFLNFSEDFGLVVSNGQLSEAQNFAQLLLGAGLSETDVDNALKEARAVLEKNKPPANAEKARADQTTILGETFNLDLEPTVSGGVKQAIG